MQFFRINSCCLLPATNVAKQLHIFQDGYEIGIKCNKMEKIVISCFFPTLSLFLKTTRRNIILNSNPVTRCFRQNKNNQIIHGSLFSKDLYERVRAVGIITDYRTWKRSPDLVISFSCWPSVKKEWPMY